MQGGFIGYIQTIGVAPEWRSRGIGRRLVAFAEERIFRDSPNVFICVSSFNPDAQRFYRSLGYEVIGDLKDFIVHGYSEILLRKTIAPWREFKKSPA
jgi:ribosomal-protein-alanine N-acetyltransferase